MRGRAKGNATASDVPGDESNYQRGAGAYLGDLRQSWGYVHVKEVIWDMFEVLERLPCVEGAFCSYWSTRFGGSVSESQKLMLEGKYNMGQSEFKQKSVIRACMTIIHSITWRSSMWSDIWGWVSIAWSETELILPIGGAVLRKTWI